jgi:5-methylcytosine-specific restriction endonuclease McrA
MPGYGAQHQRERRAALERDGWACTLRLPGCTGYATTADHVVERAAGGPDHRDNLRAACVHCNAVRGARFGNARRARARRPGPSRPW